MTTETSKVTRRERFPLKGRLIIKTNIRLLTGLHIGGKPVGIEIGAVTGQIIRNPLTNQPYLPGSSLRGKLRSLLEKYENSPFNQPIQNIHIHGYDKKDGFTDICCIFGVNSNVDVAEPTRLFVRDVDTLKPPDNVNIKEYEESSMVEVKWEAAIDRVTSAAVPRQQERISAGAVFENAELVFNFYSKPSDVTHLDDYALFEKVLVGLRLLEDDYLGGSGSRGSGKIAFENIKLFAKRVDLNDSQIYTRPERDLPKLEYPNLERLFEDRASLRTWLQQQIPLS